MINPSNTEKWRYELCLVLVVTAAVTEVAAAPEAEWAVGPEVEWVAVPEAVTAAWAADPWADIVQWAVCTWAVTEILPLLLVADTLIAEAAAAVQCPSLRWSVRQLPHWQC